MAYKFNITRGNAILNFSEEFCQSRCQLIESESFAKVLEKYIKNIKRKDRRVNIWQNKINKQKIKKVRQERNN